MLQPWGTNSVESLLSIETLGYRYDERPPAAHAEPTETERWIRRSPFWAE